MDERFTYEVIKLRDGHRTTSHLLAHVMCGSSVAGRGLLQTSNKEIDTAKAYDSSINSAAKHFRNHEAGYWRLAIEGAIQSGKEIITD